ncbi:MAG TPA: hypothetical protein VKY85_28025 [Candidatus Angelobacter sp.]|nr:hypothetical protein [Candidatus Angelobacter sp.]
MRRAMRVLLGCFALLLIWIGAEAAFAWHCDLQGQISPPSPQPQERKIATAAINGYSRPEDDTFLGYPEWYIVWSYQEKADFQEKNLPSGFLYFAAMRQYWRSYCCVSRLTRGKYGFNGGEQVMLAVIGTSFSAEYILKGIYEKTVGRVSEWTSHHEPVEEDQYAYKVAREYADFVHSRPFYEFHFARQVSGLWRDTHLWGTHPVRKWERKLFLTLDYTVEAFYCWLIEKATHLTYGIEPADTYAWIDHARPEALQQLSRVKVVKDAGSGAFIVDLPRYQEFTGAALELAQRDIHFVEIAGNSQILVSALAPASWNYRHPDAQQLFSTPILTRPEVKRVVLRCDVTSLHILLNTIRAEGTTIEHIYDY